MRLATFGRPFELVLVPNGCRDNTEEICRALSRTDPAVRVTSSDRGGWGLAVRLGLAQRKGGYSVLHQRRPDLG